MVESKDSIQIAPGTRLETVNQISREVGEYQYILLTLLDYHGEQGVKVGKRRLIDPMTKGRLLGYVKRLQESRKIARQA